MPTYMCSPGGALVCILLLLKASWLRSRSAIPERTTTKKKTKKTISRAGKRGARLIPTHGLP